MAGAVDQDDSGAAVAGVAGLRVLEDLRHDVLSVVFDRAAQPFVPGDGPRARPVVGRSAAGRGDHVVRAAG